MNDDEMKKAQSKAEWLKGKADKAEAKADRIAGQADKAEVKAERITSKADEAEARADRIAAKAEAKAAVKAANAAAIAGQPRKAQWYFTFMAMNLPVIGWFYLLYLAFRKKGTGCRTFAKAYLLYKLTFTLVAWILLGIAIYVGLGLLDQVLAYMQLL